MADTKQKAKRFVIGPLDGPYNADDADFDTLEEAMDQNRQATVHDETFGCWDRLDGFLLVGVRWQGNWYEVSA